MNVDIEFLVSFYSILSEYIPVHDQQYAADHVAALLDDYDISESAVAAFSSINDYTRCAVNKCFDDSDDNNYEDKHGYDDSDYGDE